MPSALRSTIFAVVLASTAIRTVYAQVTSNTTCSSTWKGLYNSKGQSPCLVAAYLGSVCNGGQYDVSPLDDDSHYVGPTSATANECVCSTVYYSLIGGCSTCQNATIITWSSWAEDCSEVWVDVYSENIPSDTVVPGWAYENVTTTGTFNATEAIADDSPESTATGSQTTQTGGSSSSSVTASAAPASGSSSSSGSSSHTGAIVGGVVGGVVGAALLALLAFLFLRRRNNKNDKSPQKLASPSGGAKADLTGTTYADGVSGNGYHPVPYTPGAYDQGGVNMPEPQHSQKLYDPNDPSTFPPSLNQQLTGNTYGSGMGSNDYPGSNAATQGAHSGATGPNTGVYHGYAEV